MENNFMRVDDVAQELTRSSHQYFCTAVWEVGAYLMGNNVRFDLSRMEAFFARVRQAGGGDFERAIKLFLEGLGFEFLRIIQDEIIRRQVVDTRLLLNSFQKGDKDSVWVMNEDGLSLEIGTNVDYASYVNDGHWTNKKGQAGRFVPGTFNGDQFTYQKGAKTGIYLKQKWIEGRHYWESGLRILERVYPRLLDAKLQQWLDQYFVDFI